MNFNVVTVASVLIGGVLIYSALKKRDPRDVVRMAFGKEPKFGFFGEEQGFLRPINPSGSGGGGGTPHFTSQPTAPIINLPLTRPSV